MIPIFQQSQYFNIVRSYYMLINSHRLGGPTLIVSYFDHKLIIVISKCAVMGKILFKSILKMQNKILFRSILKILLQNIFQKYFESTKLKDILKILLKIVLKRLLRNQ